MMNSLSLSNTITTSKTRNKFPFFSGNPNNFTSVTFLSPARTNISFSANAIVKKRGRRKRHERPWPNHKEVDPEWKSEHLMHLSPYKPLKERPKTIDLQFEKPILKLRKNLWRIKKFAKTAPVDMTEVVKILEANYIRIATKFYASLEPIEKVHIARHPQRPTCLDHVINMTDRWIELHGDRAGYDDPAIVCALGSMEGKTYMFIGNQKGRNSKENMKRNFGMPTPHGYRKALRFMRYAEQYGFPIVTLVDTPGAFADLKSEELNQGEAIANNLRSMFGIKVPIVSVVIGEGGSGGALAIACGNKLLMLQNAVFFVASPEACAAILYKNAKQAPKAAKDLCITAEALKTMGVCDEIIPEPLGGAHRNPDRASLLIKEHVLAAMKELGVMALDELLTKRKLKFRKIGGYKELDSIDPIKTRKMKKRDVPYSAFDMEKPTPFDCQLLEASLDNIKSEFSREDMEELLSDKFLANLDKQVHEEFIKALESFGLLKKFIALDKEFSVISKEAKLKSFSLQEYLLNYESRNSSPSPSELKEMYELLCSTDRSESPIWQKKVDELTHKFRSAVFCAENALVLKELKMAFRSFCASKHGGLSLLKKLDELMENFRYIVARPDIKKLEEEVYEEFTKELFVLLKKAELSPTLKEYLLNYEKKNSRLTPSELKEIYQFLGFRAPSLQNKVSKLMTEFRGLMLRPENALELKESYYSLRALRNIKYAFRDGVAKINNSLGLTEKAVNEEFKDAFEKFGLKGDFDELNNEVLALGERPKLNASSEKMVRRLMLKYREKISCFDNASELKEAYVSFCDVRRLSFNLKESEEGETERETEAEKEMLFSNNSQA